MATHSCELCTSPGVETKFWTLNARKTHAQFHVIQLTRISDDGDQPSIKEIFGKCFPLLGDFEKSEEIEKSRSTLFEICKSIIKSKKNDSNSIECQICGTNCPFMKTKGYGVRTAAILAHAGFHSTKKPIACRECPQALVKKANVISHIKNVHKIDSPIRGVHFDENWNECFDELKESLMKCFGVLDLDQALSSKNRTPPSELAVHRRAIFLNIVKTASEDKKVHCDRCQKKICARGGRYFLEEHIHSHLHRRIFECKLCDVSTIHKTHMTTHLKKEHDISSEGNYVDRSDEHHKEILDWVKKCFGKEMAK